MKSFLSLLFIFSLIACNSQMKKIDTLIINGKVYTCDSNFSESEAIALDDGRIVETGSTAALSEKYAGAEVIDATGKFIYPGFIDAHAHFLGYGLGLREADLIGTNSWEEILERLQNYAKEHPEGWITGRGWDQNDWKNKSFPDNTQLNALFPDRPVVLSRVDGHAAIANQKALDMAGVHPGDAISGGDIEVKDNRLTGILIDNAMSLVYDQIPAPDKEQMTDALKEAEKNCFAAGLTTIVDCGLPYQAALLIDSLQQQGTLKMRMYIMLSDAQQNYDYLFEHGPIETDRLQVRSFKLFADGALGSRGACLMQPYSDKPGWNGFLLSSASHFDEMAAKIYEHGFQMCTHAIGDSGNRVILETYAKYLKGPNDRRWRIEHAQVINENDFHYFGDYDIIPSVQPTHATSDMYWADERLGEDRIKHAYANKELLMQNGWIPLGTDFPVEDISPIKTFYAAVFRQDASGYPEGGFQMQNALFRKETLWGMTLWAAKGNFEEKKKGSIEAGKMADLLMLDTDLMQADAKDVLRTKVLMTIVGGEKVFMEK